MVYDIIIRNGKIFDGTGNPWTQSDIGIIDGKIHTISNLNGFKANTEINAKDLAVAPGFIDCHVHADLLCTKPEIHKIRVRQGVTTELIGQDGISVAPVTQDVKPLWQKQLKAIIGDIGDWPWNSVQEYLDFLDQKEKVGNVLYLIPHGAVRSSIMGFEGRIATQDELSRICYLVELGMQQGAVGFSSGLVYPPNIFSNQEELIEICKVVARYDGVFVVHIRNESTYLLESLDEVIDIARQSGVRLHISHFKAIGKVNRNKFESALAKIDSGRNEGLEITFDQYPYPAASTVFDSILPPWVHSGGTEELLRRLKDPAQREKIKYDFNNNSDYENWVISCGWENIFISSVSSEQNRSLEGKNLVQIAEIRGKDPADAAMDLLIEENAGIAMVVYWGYEEDVIYGMRHPLQVVGSDGIFGGKPHPRLYGTFPRLLGRFVREKKALTLSQAIRQMTGGPAQLLRLKDRGFLREGYAADIVVFDPDKVADQATFENPLQEPIGIPYVIVNGQIAVHQERFTGITAGRVIRGSK